MTKIYRIVEETLGSGAVQYTIEMAIGDNPWFSLTTRNTLEEARRCRDQVLQNTVVKRNVIE